MGQEPGSAHHSLSITQYRDEAHKELFRGSLVVFKGKVADIRLRRWWRLGALAQVFPGRRHAQVAYIRGWGCRRAGCVIHILTHIRYRERPGKSGSASTDSTHGLQISAALLLSAALPGWRARLNGRGLSLRRRFRRSGGGRW